MQLVHLGGGALGLPGPVLPFFSLDEGGGVRVRTMTDDDDDYVAHCDSALAPSLVLG